MWEYSVSPWNEALMVGISPLRAKVAELNDLGGREWMWEVW